MLHTLYKKIGYLVVGIKWSFLSVTLSIFAYSICSQNGRTSCKVICVFAVIHWKEYDLLVFVVTIQSFSNCNGILVIVRKFDMKQNVLLLVFVS